MIEPRDRQPLTREQQERCWEIFTYEIDMFAKLSAYLSPDAEQSTEFATFRQVIKNAVVESCVLHYRNVCDILLSVGRHGEDIRLDDLLPGFHTQALEALANAYGFRGMSGRPAHLLHYQALQPWLGRDRDSDYGPTLALLKPIIDAVLYAIRDRAGPAILAALENDRQRSLRDH